MQNARLFNLLLPEIEEAMNRMSSLEKWSLESIDDALSRQNQKETDAAAKYAEKLLIKRGYQHKNGEAYHVKFCKHARIAPDVWSAFRYGKNNPDPDTRMKIVIGLQMTLPEAEEFLSLLGASFSLSNPVHRLLMACIECGFYDPDDVYDVLEYYRPQYEKQGKKYHNIYEER